jgi:hypothetical protein
MVAGVVQHITFDSFDHLAQLGVLVSRLSEYGSRSFRERHRDRLDLISADVVATRSILLILSAGF